MPLRTLVPRKTFSTLGIRLNTILDGKSILIIFLFWWDNWTSQGFVYQIERHIHKSCNIKVKTFISDKNWDFNSLKNIISESTLNPIKDIPIVNIDVEDRAIWTPSDNGFFSCAFAFNFLRQKHHPFPSISNIWIKELPFKKIYLCENCLK